MKKKLLITLSVATLLLGGGAAYALTSTNDNNDVASVSAEAPKKSTTVTAEPVVEVKTEEATPVETTPVAPAPVEAPAPVVRSFDEIILDYPNMSTGYKGVECSKVVEAAYPERFTPEKREFNIALLARVFSHSCAAAFKGTNGDAWVIDDKRLIYMADIGQGDFWQRFGGM